MIIDVNEITSYGAPVLERINEIKEKVKSSTTKHPLEFMGKYSDFPVIDVRIEFPVYRISNGRTRTLQLEHITLSNLPDNYFESNYDSLEVQVAQHSVLKKLVDEEGLFDEFRKSFEQQTEPIICTNQGVVVNGNRRLCTWRELYYKDKIKYKHFETIKIVVLPDCDEKAIDDLEKKLQIQKTMRAEYSWHAIAFMAEIELKDKKKSIQEIAKDYGKSPNDIKVLIESKAFAAQYLEDIGRKNEWSLLDKEAYAFAEIVKNRKKLLDPIDKELFEKITKELISTEAKDVGRLYSVIPKIVLHFESIKNSLKEKYKIEKSEVEIGGAELLFGGEEQESNITTQIIDKIDTEDDTEKIVDLVTKTIKTQELIEKEVKSENYVLEQWSKAAADSLNAVSKEKDGINGNGKSILKHIETIKQNIKATEEWVKELDGD